ncbi:MAG TPA: glycosyltransferase [Anaerolineae bacterium]|nr:glycosyltransferase [Anaerolineae bacterium]
MSILVTIYVIAALLLALYGFNAWILTGLFFAQRRSKPPADPSLPQAKFPAITVQLPIYNEALVVERLIDAVVKLDYPASRLQIQVLDDSTDETTAIAERRVKMYRRRGVNIQLVHRAHRAGFKAGALKNGLETATGTLIAIFDADFVPDPNFLKQTVSYFAANPQLGLLQTRWGHLNRSYSWLTLAQGLALDGHFAVEQVARNRGGLLINFNGTAGLWRRGWI